MTERRRLASVSAGRIREPAPDLRDAVRTALGAMDWLTPADEATKTLALRLADEIEKASDRAAEAAAVAAKAGGEMDIYKRLKALEAHCNVTKTVGWLGPQLHGVLRDLARRGDDGGEAKPVGGRLEALRAAAGKHDT